METIQYFLDFWSRKAANSDANRSDPAHPMFEAYQKVMADLQQSKAQTLQFIIPINTGKGFQPGFDPSAIDKVAELSAQINELGSKLESTSKAIIDFMIVVGAPYLHGLQDNLISARSILGRSQIACNDLRTRALKRNPKLSMLEISELPDVKRAESEREVKRQKQQPIMDELVSKIQQAQAICDKYTPPAPQINNTTIGGYTLEKAKEMT